jgi:hypothetical protein
VPTMARVARQEPPENPQKPSELPPAGPCDLLKIPSPGGELNSYRLITRQVLCR